LNGKNISFAREFGWDDFYEKPSQILMKKKINQK